MEMRLSMKIDKRIFFHRPGRLPTFFKIQASAPGGSMRWRKFALPLGAQPRPEKIHACARGGTSNPTNFDLAPWAQAPFSETFPLRPRRRDV